MTTLQGSVETSSILLFFVVCKLLKKAVLPSSLA